MAFLGRYAPGIQGPRIGELTKPETDAIEKAVMGLLDAESKERVEHTKAAMRAAASRPTLF